MNETDKKAAEKPMNTDKNKTKIRQATTLYRVVFNGRISSWVVLLLLSSILLQPIDRARADESTPVESAAPIDTSVVTTASADEIVNTDTQIAEELVLTTDSPVIDTTTATTASATSSDDTSEDETIVSTSDQETTTTLEETIADDTATTTSVDGNSDADTTIASSSLDTSNQTDEDVAHESIVETTATTTDEIIASSTSSSTATTTGENAIAISTVTSDSLIQFDKADCVAVSDGSFYCRAKPAVESNVKDGLYSRPDADGDLEIFFVKDTIETQITHNLVDDAAPYYDAQSNSIVWHRLIDDRYQIMAYDLKTGSEAQLTTDSVNNMEPTRAGKYTVWQHWNQKNWDIMLYDGNETTLLTDTPEHDIAPNIRGNLVMWNRLTSDGAQTIELYDLDTHEYTTIADTEGGALSNPRMVLVYETEFENGDVVTKGYDVETGEITALNTIPADLPDEIPAPDNTGETRALIQAKTSSKEDVEAVTPVPQGGTGAGNGTSSATSTLNNGTSTLDMNASIEQGAPSNLATSSNSIIDSVTLDLRVPTETSTTTNFDIVVPPLGELNP